MASSFTDVQKIVVSLSETDITIDPGSVTQMTVTISNQQETADRVSLEIEGIDVEWYAIPVPAANVAPGASVVLKVPFRVARDSSNKAGTYPFLVRVQAMESGELGVAQASLNVHAFNSLQVELNPKRAIATFFHPLNDFDFTLINQGNSEETLDLFASDQDDSCAFEFDVDRLSLKPGQSVVVPLAVRPKAAALIGGTRIYGFSASARSHDDAYVSANAHGQIEKHALVSPLLGIFLLLLGFGGAAFAFFKPKAPEPVKILKFAAFPKQLVQGQATTLTWEVSGLQSANRHLILSHTVGNNGAEITDQELKDDNFSMKVTPDGSTTYHLKAYNSGGLKPVFSSTDVKVTMAPDPPKPVISSFTASPTKIHQGESVMLTWVAKNHELCIIDPGNVKLSKLEQSKQIDGINSDTTYKLRALNVKSDKTTVIVEKEVRVKVVPANVSLCEIEYFAFKESPVYIGELAHLKWNATYARSAKVDCSDPNISSQISAVPAVNGSLEFKLSINAPVTFTLTVTDAANLSVSRSVTITPRYRPAPKPPVEAPQQTDPEGSQDATKPPTNL